MWCDRRDGEAIRLHQTRSADFLADFDIPVSQIEEVLPTIVIVQMDVDLDEWSPFRAFRFSDEVQASFKGSAIGFPRVAKDAGANDVFPSSGAAAIPGDNMIQIQVIPVKSSSTILACILVALKNVVPGEFHLFFREAVEYN